MSSIGWERKKTRLDPESLAMEMASEGAPEGTVIRAGTAGRKSLSFSVILRPRPDRPRGLLAIIATFCASEGIRKDTGIITWMRWPDEVVAGRDMIAATSLVQGGGTNRPWVILNFRINLRDPPKAGSTSLHDLLGVDVDPEMLESKVLDSLSWMHSGWVKQMYPQILPRISSMLENAGGRVVADRGGRAVSGVVRGVDEAGRLVVDLDDSGQARIEDRTGLLEF